MVKALRAVRAAARAPLALSFRDLGLEDSWVAGRTRRVLSEGGGPCFRALALSAPMSAAKRLDLLRHPAMWGAAYVCLLWALAAFRYFRVVFCVLVLFMRG